ncbi:PrpF domain-containing protein [Oscillibacter sp.]|uniref:2-methylaconitate cis-trans isomerase PrpF family protein n=1 Tax=Oscillibacter sp. TaxID=1945593 RepID=UPI00289B9550|nr:PrpF domain-containing protein [Oscillibacter sp.]
MNQSNAIRCSIVRGGTSKAIFIMENQLPRDPVLREKTILALYGSPDIREIDGLGGGDLLTSKLAIIGPPSCEGADVDYTFGQVSMDEAFVEFNSNCGNISAGVGPFAIHAGLVRAVEPVTTVRIHLVNLDRIMVAQVPVVDGEPAVDGDFAIDGVPGTGARIALDWSAVFGGTTGKLLPTGNPLDEVTLDGKAYHISIVDAGTISVFIHASELNMTGVETPQEIEGDQALCTLLESIRGKACELLGLVEDYRDAVVKTPYLPFICPVTEAADYTCFNGTQVKKEDIAFAARLFNMGHLVNKTYAGSGTVCTGVAARIEGTVVNRLLKDAAKQQDIIYFGHASGRIPVESTVCKEADGSWRIEKANIFRTARVLMDGTAYVRHSAIEEKRLQRG